MPVVDLEDHFPSVFEPNGVQSPQIIDVDSLDIEDIVDVTPSPPRQRRRVTEDGRSVPVDEEVILLQDSDDEVQYVGSSRSTRPRTGKRPFCLSLSLFISVMMLPQNVESEYFLLHRHHKSAEYRQCQLFHTDFYPRDECLPLLSLPSLSFPTTRPLHLNSMFDRSGKQAHDLKMHPPPLLHRTTPLLWASVERCWQGSGTS